jgi:hypothetical protein
VIVYLNGAEIFRDNMPQGPVTPSTFANATITGAGETTYHEFDVDPALLLPGENIVAAEVHQSALDSSDLGFDLAIEGQRSFLQLPPPRPAAGWTSDGRFAVAFNGLDLFEGLAFVVERSFDLISWQTIHTGVISGGGAGSFAEAPAGQRAFYRIQILEP